MDAAVIRALAREHPALQGHGVYGVRGAAVVEAAFRQPSFVTETDLLEKQRRA
jgi:hypothetical protein